MNLTNLRLRFPSGFLSCLFCLASTIILGSGCEIAQQVEPVGRSALADSLLSIFEQATTAVSERRYPEFLRLVDPDERRQLEEMVAQYGYSSIKAYLDQQMHGWPNLDTLTLTGFVSDGTHARITFEGNGSNFGLKRSVRYTIVMLRLTPDGWLLTAMTSIEKDAEDQFGNRLTYHETELPTKLRFPRPF